MRQFLVAGNWKMTTTHHEAEALAKGIADGVAAANDSVEVLVCPPFPYLMAVRDAIQGSRVRLGAQNAYFEKPGAFTGEVAVEMLLDVGCDYVILGHSERRHVIGEGDELINKKVVSALQGGVKVILCVGELLSEREAGKTEVVLDTQMEGGLAGLGAEGLDNVVIAYEPVWAIGTGKRATTDQAESAHAHLRKWLENRYNSNVAEKMRILYGGSVKPKEPGKVDKELIGLLEQPNVDGALVGGASLKAETFLPIVEAALEVAGR